MFVIGCLTELVLVKRAEAARVSGSRANHTISITCEATAKSLQNQNQTALSLLNTRTTVDRSTKLLQYCFSQLSHLPCQSFLRRVYAISTGNHRTEDCSNKPKQNLALHVSDSPFSLSFVRIMDGGATTAFALVPATFEVCLAFSLSLSLSLSLSPVSVSLSRSLSHSLTPSLSHSLTLGFRVPRLNEQRWRAPACCDASWRLVPVLKARA